MSDSVSEAVLKALFVALEAGAPSGVRALRNATLPGRIPAGGLLILRDGDPGEPEPTLSPLAYHYQHRAELEFLVSGEEGGPRDDAFDALKLAVAVAVSADRTLGGLCDWIEAQAPAPQDVSPEGGQPIKAAIVPIILHYSTPDPLL
ncbi:hypothetical protein SAMN05444336_112118 [Albimonas donghaensis]|uniref:Acyl-CoA transferase n=1 Tax=Albimonas donghaensis TaxID=356660 RepID=A0A1H3FJ13_9RHOB|nr:acyl-CoA transferase [Albimonas donghaensis]SDX90358.1 hypothetical protein SAMN05444336_112118 [Albimonas donghaensis]